MKKKKQIIFYNFYVYIRPIITLLIFLSNFNYLNQSNFMEQFHIYKICYIGFTIILLFVNIILMSKSYDKSPGTYYFAKKVALIELALDIILDFIMLYIIDNYEITEVSYFKVSTSIGTSIIWFWLINNYLNNKKEILLYEHKKKTNNIKTNKTIIENSVLDKYNELIKLDELRKKGIITDEEFDKEKSKLLK